MNFREKASNILKNYGTYRATSKGNDKLLDTALDELGELVSKEIEEARIQGIKDVAANLNKVYPGIVSEDEINETARKKLKP